MQNSGVVVFGSSKLILTCFSTYCICWKAMILYEAKKLSIKSLLYIIFCEQFVLNALSIIF